MAKPEVSEILPESKDLINKVYPEADAGKLQEWLVGSAHEQELMGELEKNTHDVKNAGISRLGILVEACANYYFRTVFDRDDRLTADTRTKLGLEILQNVAKKTLSEGAGESEVKAKMAEIYNEGVEEVELAEGVNVFQIKEPTSTDLAEAVEKVVKDWVSTGSLQARVEQLQQQLGKPETETWADEKKQAAKDKFAKIHEPQRKKIDSLAEALIDVDERETVEFLSNLPVWKLQYDLLETKNAAALKILLAGQKLGGQPIDGQTELIGSLEEVLKMRKPANQPDKLLETSRFFGSLSDIVRWRREIISQRQKTEAEINDYVKRLGLRMAWGNELEAVKVEEALTDYRTKASDLETAFPAVDLKAIGEESNLEAVELSLDPGWRVGRTKLKLRTIESKEKMARITAALPLLIEYKQFKLAGDYTIKQEGEKIWLYSENTRIGMVNASGTGEVELEWIEGLPVQSSLQATSALAAGLLEFIFKEEGRFPVFSLAAAEPPTPLKEAPVAAEEDIPDWLKALRQEQKQPETPAEPEAPAAAEEAPEKPPVPAEDTG